MKELSQIMLSQKDKLLYKRYRNPSITAYNRLEPRPRTEDFERSLRAEVRDGLWMLTRQWQMGELEAEDAGSAIDARILTTHQNIDSIALKENAPKNYDAQIPLETMVEAEVIPFTHALKVQIAQYFLQLHSDRKRTKYLSKYMQSTVFGFDPNKEEEFKGQIDGLNLYRATRNRMFDGEKLIQSINAGTFKSIVGIDHADDVEMDLIVQGLKDWLKRQYYQPAQKSDSAWNPKQLDYQFTVKASGSAGGDSVLSAHDYHQGRLDWYAFDYVTVTQTERENKRSSEKKGKGSDPISFIPNTISFKGMPNPRFWEMEDRQINFGNINAKTTDHLLLLLAEFGLIYDNDWFVIPYSLPVNTLCEIQGLVVTDVFGDRTLIRAADEGVDNNWQRWSMFNLSNKDHMGSYNRQFFLPATLTQTLESEPIEKVSFIRDEMANMVWGIEDVIPDATNRGIPGYEAADKTGIEPPVIADSPAKIRYLLGTTVPENWIPFMPVHKPGSNQEIYFQRAAMPKLGETLRDVIKAKGVLLNEVPSPYYIEEEEIPYSGTIVTRTYQRTRWYQGKTYIWIGRYRETGRGEGASGLAFDQIVSTKKAK
jgi:hypothetical protein